MNNAIVMLMLVCMLPSMAAAQVAKVVTNGELDPERAFHFVVLHDRSATSAAVLQMVRQPRTQAMQQWALNCDLRAFNCDEPEDLTVAKSHHQYLLSKHQNQLPILALVDGTGGVWWSGAGRDLPRTEQELAGVLAEYYSATINAAQASGQNPPVRPAGGPAQGLGPGSGPRMPLQRSDGSYFMRRPVEDRPRLFNPQLDVAVPDTINTEFALATNVVVLLIGGGFIAVVCCLILACGRVVAAALQPDSK